MDDRGVKASAARTTALLATVLCAFALLAPTTAKAATGKANTGIHLVKVVTVGSPNQHAMTLRPRSSARPQRRDRVVDRLGVRCGHSNVSHDHSLVHS